MEKSILGLNNMTIFALSSGSGISGVAVIRVSGKNAAKVIKELTGLEPPVPRMATLRKVSKNGQKMSKNIKMINSWVHTLVMDEHLNQAQKVERPIAKM